MLTHPALCINETKYEQAAKKWNEDVIVPSIQFRAANAGNHCCGDSCCPHKSYVSPLALVLSPSLSDFTEIDLDQLDIFDRTYFPVLPEHKTWKTREEYQEGAANHWQNGFVKDTYDPERHLGWVANVPLRSVCAVADDGASLIPVRHWNFLGAPLDNQPLFVNINGDLSIIQGKQYLPLHYMCYQRVIFDSKDGDRIVPFAALGNFMANITKKKRCSFYLGDFYLRSGHDS